MTAHLVAGNPPCNGCVRCCINDAVRLLPGDDASRYQTEPHPYLLGQRMLAHKPDTTCIYLAEHGCGIYERRPQQCREMDCRLIAQRMTYTQARKTGALPAWIKGRALLAKQGAA